MTAKVDWDALEIDFRAGVLSFAQMSEKYGVSKGRISQVSKAKGWERDLSLKIKAKADAKLNEEILKLNEAKQRLEKEDIRKHNKISRQDAIVEANASVQANVRSKHRRHIDKATEIVMSLFDELEHVTNNGELFRRLGELLKDPDERGVDKLNDLYNKVISMDSRAKMAKALTDGLRSLIETERVAHGISEDPVKAATDIAAMMQAARARGGINNG